MKDKPEETLEEKLKDYRERIDVIDDKLLALLEERIQIVHQVAQIKKSSHLPVIDFRREKRILDRLSGKGKGILPLVTLQNIYREILGASRSCQTAAMLPESPKEIGHFTPWLCLSIMERENESVIQSLEFPGADLVEWRIDATVHPDIERVLARKTMPIICTNRPNRFGGFYGGSETDRIRMLLDAAESGADYIDIELMENTKKLVGEFPEACKIIVSYHNYEGTPSDDELSGLAEEMMETAAFLVKIVTVARTAKDCLRVLKLIPSLLERGQEVVAFCMGPLGKWTRIASLFLGAYLTYGAKSPEKLAAPGQLTIPQIRHLLSMLC